MLEIEVKIKVENPESAGQMLKALGAEVDKGRHYEQNTLYDFVTRQLQGKGHALRLRKVDKKIFLTFKGTRQKSRKFKIREEYETEVKNEKQITNILKSLGLRPVFAYKKHRTVYRKKKLKICLDETSIGTFLELEGQRNDIVRFAQALQISKKDFIIKDYIQLILEAEQIQKKAIQGKGTLGDRTES
jgi:predicted adenylyl cyclase CyaB